MLVGKSTKTEVDNICLSGRVGECLKTKGECGSEVEEKVLTSAGRSWVWLLAKRRATWAPETSDPPGLPLDNHGNHVRVSWAEEEDAWYDWNCTHGRFLLLSISVDIHQHPFPIMMSAPYCQVGGFQSISKWIFHFLHQIHQLHILGCRHLLEDFPGDKQTPGELRWPLWRHFEEGVQMGREVQPHGRSQFKTGGGGGEPFGRETKWGGRPYQVHMCPSAPSQSHPGAPLLWWGRSTKVLLGSFFCTFLTKWWHLLCCYFGSTQLIGVTSEMFYPNPSQAMRWTSLYSNFVFPPSPPSKQQDWDNHYGEFLNLSMVSIILVLAVSRRCEIKCQPKYYKVSLPAPLRALLRENTKWEPHHILQGIGKTKPSLTNSGLCREQKNIACSNGKKRRSGWKKN